MHFIFIMVESPSKINNWHCIFQIKILIHLSWNKTMYFSQQAGDTNQNYLQLVKRLLEFSFQGSEMQVILLQRENCRHISIFSSSLPNIGLPSFFTFFLFLSFLVRAVPAAYGSSQARSQNRAAAATLCHSHSNAGSFNPISTLRGSAQQCWIGSFNPLSKAKDQTHIFMDTSQVLNLLSHNWNAQSFILNELVLPFFFTQVH